MRSSKREHPFVELLKCSALVQGSIALSCTITICYMFAVGRTVPDTLVWIVFLILGYYFGTKTQQSVNREVIDNAAQYRTAINSGTDPVA